MRRRIAIMTLVWLATSLTVNACTPVGKTASESEPSTETASKSAEPPLNVGVGTDMPGLGTLDPSSHVRAGFDIDLARWLANEEPKFQPVFVDLPIKERDKALVNSKVGVVVEAFSITDERRKSVSFAGPYLITQQGVLVRTGDRSVVTPNDLAGKSVCTQEGSTSLDQLNQTLQDKVSVTALTGIGECVDKLRAGQFDAVSTDQLILYGYAQADKQRQLTVVPDLIFGAKERYGVGLPKGDVTRCEEVTEKIREFITSGVWDRFFFTNFGQLNPAGYKPDPYVLDSCK